MAVFFHPGVSVFFLNLYPGVIFFVFKIYTQGIFFKTLQFFFTQGVVISGLSMELLSLIGWRLAPA